MISALHRINPRSLSAKFISKLVEVDGIVTKCSLVRPKLMKSVHYAEATGAFLSREYRDVTSNTGLPTGSVYPTKDEEGNLLTTEFGLCTYKNHQTITIQVWKGCILLQKDINCPCNTQPSSLTCRASLSASGWGAGSRIFFRLEALLKLLLVNTP